MADLPGVWTYHGITLDQLKALAVKLGESQLVGPQLMVGRVKTHGVEIGWVYDPPTQTLTVTAYNETWLVKYDRIKSEVDELLGVVGA